VRQYSRVVAERADVASEPNRIVLADDHPLIRGGLRRVLDLEEDVRVVGEAGDVEGALALTREHQPRVVVLDLNMPGEPTLRDPAVPRGRPRNRGPRVDDGGRAGLRAPGAWCGGLVFRATDRTLERPVALKVIAPEKADSPTYRARFERECRLAASLHHPNVVEIFHAGEADGLLYLTMRYVDGTDLGKLLDGGARLEPARAASILSQVAGALEEAHGFGLVHRDVKPENVLITQRAGREHAFLTDFGITKRADEQPLTRTGVALGSADYMAPEQAHGGEVDARADVYSLGCVLYRMLTGRVVFDRPGELETLWAHVHDPLPRLVNPEVPAGLQAVLDRALAKDPRDRQQSAAELGENVAAVFAA
jgi:protein kinase-like protein/response regulator receiver domain-containing protein